MIDLLSALQFLTAIPFGIKGTSQKDMAKSLVYFPIVGLLIGLLAAGINNLALLLNFNALAASIMAVVTLIIITRGLHLDGLSDSADAFFSGKPKEEMLIIMRDSHAGVMGILSIITVILLKIALLSSINIPLRANALMLSCALSRWCVVPAMLFFPYARQEGKAGIFIKGLNPRILTLSSLVAVACAALAWGIKGLILLVPAAAFSYFISRLITKKIGGITGDTLGAIVELTETLTLLFVCAGQGGA